MPMRMGLQAYHMEAFNKFIFTVALIKTTTFDKLWTYNMRQGGAWSMSTSTLALLIELPWRNIPYE